MTNEQIEELKRLDAAATPGPWVRGGIAHNNAVLATILEPDLSVGFPGLMPVYPSFAYPNDNAPQGEEGDNLDLIVALRNSLPAIISDLERMEVVEKEREALEKVAHWAQACLTALNVGDIQSESLLHKKLREVMIEYRSSMEATNV